MQSLANESASEPGGARVAAVQYVGRVDWHAHAHAPLPADACAAAPPLWPAVFDATTQQQQQRAQRILCIVLVYSEFAVAHESLEFLMQCSRQWLDLIVVENRSEHTSTLFEPYLVEQVRAGRVQRYYQMHENIATNAFQMALERAQRDGLLASVAYPYVLLTEGDLVVREADNRAYRRSGGHSSYEHTADAWLREQMHVLRSDASVGVCAASLDLANLPTHVFADARHWLPDATAVTALYVQRFTGLHLLLMRTDFVNAYIDYRRAADERFAEVSMHRFCTAQANQRWVHVRHALTRHLTWDLYCDAAHPYTRYKQQGGAGIFSHRRLCGANEWRHEPQHAATRVQSRPVAQTAIERFDAAYYLDAYADLRRNGVLTAAQARAHYERHGRRERRRAHSGDTEPDRHAPMLSAPLSALAAAAQASGTRQPTLSAEQILTHTRYAESHRVMRKEIAPRVGTMHHHAHVLLVLLDLLGARNYLEIGTCLGASACLATYCDTLRAVHAIDTCQMTARQADLIRENFAQYVARNRSVAALHLHECRSDDRTLLRLLYQRSGAPSFDVIFIDGSHLAADVHADFVHYGALLRPGGVLVFDDYMDGVYSAGVRHAVDALILPTLQRDGWNVLGVLPNRAGAYADASVPALREHSNLFIAQKWCLPALTAHVVDAPAQPLTRDACMGVLITTWPGANREALLHRALVSVVRQTHPHWLVILVADHYADDAPLRAAVQRAGIDARRCVLVNLPLACEREFYAQSTPHDREMLWHTGGVTAMNYALELCAQSGVRVAAHLDDDDDEWQSEHLAALLQHYAAPCNASVVYARGWSEGARHALPDDSRAQHSTPPEPGHVCHSAVSWRVDRLPLRYRACERFESGTVTAAAAAVVVDPAATSTICMPLARPADAELWARMRAEHLLPHGAHRVCCTGDISVVYH